MICIITRAGYVDSPAQGSSAAEAGAPAAEARSLLSIQRRRVDSANGYVHRPGALAGLHLVHHRQQRAQSQPVKLDSR